MSKTTVKRQHTVWRKYLQPWTDDLNSTEGKLYCLFKDKNVVSPKPISILNLAAKTYAYDISMITKEDENLFSLFFKNLLNEPNTTINKKLPYKEKDFLENQFISKYENIGEKFLKRMLDKKIPFDKQLDLGDSFKFLYLNELYKRNEISKETYDIKAKEMEEKIINSDDEYLFFLFVSIQMFRTLGNKELVMNATNEAKNIYKGGNFEGTSEAIFPLSMIPFSKKLADFFYENNYCVELICNETNINFITSDNSVVTYGDCKSFFEAYYPISPKIAIFLKRTIYNNVVRACNDINEINRLNNLTYERSFKQVYAKEYDELVKFLKK